MLDLLITNGNIVTPSGVFRGSIAVEEGKIVDAKSKSGANKVLDADGKYVFPGAIDPHVHLMGGSQPKTFTENVLNETPSIIFGGTTSILSMTSDPKGYKEILPAMLKDIESHSMVDTGLNLVINNARQVNEIKFYAERFGVQSFKFYPAGRGNLDEREIYPNIYSVDDGEFFKGLGIIGSMGYPALALAHAENHEMAWTLKEKLIAEGRKDQEAWAEARPNFVEEDAMRRIIFLAGLQRCPIYLVHVSTREGPGLIREARAKGQRVFGEAVIHYLTFTIHDEFKKRCGVIGKCTPPLREKEDREALWQGLASNTLACVGSDHIANRTKKTYHSVPGDESPFTCKGVYPGSGLVLPVMLSEGVSKKRISLERVAQVCSYNPARIFGLYPQKGNLNPGADADIVIVDMKKEFVGSPDGLHLSSDFTWYDKYTFRGWPTHVILRGRTIVQDGEIIEKPGYAKYLARRQGAGIWPYVS